MIKYFLRSCKLGCYTRNELFSRSQPLVGNACLDALHRTTKSSQFLENLVRLHVVETNLETAYCQMTLDESRELEALEWAEAK